MPPPAMMIRISRRPAVASAQRRQEVDVVLRGDAHHLGRIGDPVDPHEQVIQPARRRHLEQRPCVGGAAVEDAVFGSRVFGVSFLIMTGCGAT
jgi:hypothetical protein